MMDRQPLAAAGSPIASSPRGELATDWPILAQLPWISGAVESHQAYTGGNYRRYDAAEHGAEQDTLSSRFAEATQPRLGNEAPLTAGAAVVASTEINSRRWRIDSALDASSDLAPRPHAAAFLPERTTIAARLFQWHVALAPHAGLSLTAALVVAVGVLSWLTFGPRSAPAPSKTVQTPLWPKEATAPLTLHLPADGLSPTDDLSQFSWSARLLPKPVPATVEPPNVPIAHAPAAEPSDASDSPMPQTVQPEPPAPKNEPLPVAVARPDAKQIITPTPIAPVYPSTRFYENSRMIDPSVIEPPAAVSATPTSQPSR